MIGSWLLRRVLLALEWLKKVLEAGLPKVSDDGTYQQMMFVGN